ncbi:hypothetical protein FSARC_7292 [Fusarium sarcochroum]|uniref:DUF6590 domain-containing protein n=1 Tax=Fusarium sarcochroum TaxID=1208366 RepID=A0A8H4TVG0_9HYPO|nr:hypothetical protein FSARC_7292 [Fusarium sarcochroum]
MYQTSRTRWDEWSEWIFHQEYQQYYRQRLDSSGRTEFQWQRDYEAEQNNQIPRTPVDQMTQQFQTVNLQSPEQTFGEEQNYDEYSVAGGPSSRSKSKTSRSHSSSSKPKSRSRTSKPSSGKGKGVAYEDIEENREPDDGGYYTQQRTVAEPASQTYVDPATGQYYAYPQSGQADPPLTEPYADGSAEQDEEELQAAIAQSRYYTRDQYQSGEASEAYAPYEAQDEEEDTGSSMPGIELPILKTFNPARQVFKVLWPEPAGGGGGAPSIAEETVYRDQYGGRIFVHFRRFIIVANDLGHCTCARPISTYGRKGCKKSGVKAEQHGLVTESSNRKPTVLPGEPKLGFAPIRVHIYEQGERISKESRVNYSKLTTIEHNVKVLFIGRVVGGDWDIVTDAVETSWANKMHKKKHRR